MGRPQRLASLLIRNRFHQLSSFRWYRALRVLFGHFYIPPCLRMKLPACLFCCLPLSCFRLTAVFEARRFMSATRCEKKRKKTQAQSKQKVCYGVSRLPSSAPTSCRYVLLCFVGNHGSSRGKCQDNTTEEDPSELMTRHQNELCPSRRVFRTPLAQGRPWIRP